MKTLKDKFVIFADPSVASPLGERKAGGFEGYNPPCDKQAGGHTQPKLHARLSLRNVGNGTRQNR